MRPRQRSGWSLTKSLRNSFRSILAAGVSQFNAGGVGGWLQSLLAVGVSRFNTGDVGGWLRSLLAASVSQFNAGGVVGWLQSLLKAGVSRFKAGGVGLAAISFYFWFVTISGWWCGGLAATTF